MSEQRGFSVDAAFWRAACENATTALFILNGAKECVYLNRAAQELTGYGSGEAECRRLDQLLLCHPADDGGKGGDNHPIAQALAAGPRIQGEDVFSRKDGEPYPAAFTVSTINGDDGIGAVVEVRSRVAHQAQERTITQMGQRLELALSAGRAVGIWDWDVDKDILQTDERFAKLFGIDPEIAATGLPMMTFVESIHPDDRARVVAAVDLAIETGEEYESEYRLAVPGAGETWVLARGRRFHDEVTSGRRFTGVIFDITQFKTNEANLELLARELDHRVKNTFQTIQAIAKMSFAQDDVPQGVADAFYGRLHALSDTHNLLLSKQLSGADLREVINRTLAPFGYEPDQASAIAVSGPPIELTSKQAQTMAMAMHELATNAAKYGSLSCEEGVVEVDWSPPTDEQEAFSFQWRERNGPPVEKQPERRGFGTTVLTRIVPLDMNGTATLEYAPKGLAYELRARMRR